MGSVIEKVQSRLLRIRPKAKSADAAIRLLETVEVHRAETESRGEERANSSTVRHQHDGLPGVSCEEIIPKQPQAIIKAANGELNLVIGHLNPELARTATPFAALSGKPTGILFNRLTL